MSLRRITYDSPVEPWPDDALRTTAGTCYRIVTVREVKRRTRESTLPRWALLVERVDDVDDAPVVHPLVWYPRGRRR